ncbi:MAG: glycosyltransferase [Planctomycetota bacterium]|nr:glycosyltransferase [Planctomycetota bacterium]
MRLAIDYWPGATHEPGVGRYVREFTRALLRLEDAPTTTLLDWGPGKRLETAENAGSLPARARLVRRKLPRAWLERLAGLGLAPDRLAGGCDVLHASSIALPRPARARSSLALSSPPASPHELEGRAAVITFSEHARRELVEHFGVPRERVFVVPVGCGHFSADLAAQRAPAERSATLRVLALGRIDRSRSPLELLAACERLAAAGQPLELTFLGRVGDAYDELRARATRSPISSRVRFDSTPDDSKTRRALAAHDVLAQLVTDDWTAVTPLEAAACGLAPVAARVPAYEEALGGLAHWVEPSPEPAQLADALAAAFASHSDPAQVAARAALASRFTWERNAALTLAALRSIL